MPEESGPSSEPASEAGLAAGEVVAGRYRILGHLGSGGMGAVYRAEHVHMRKTVALKVLHRELSRVNEVVARFEREAIAAGQIDHPNVAAASDFGKLEDGSFYLVLEFVDGESLRSVIAKGPLPHVRALEIARQTALALRAAHALEIVHRDLKPDNVMLMPGPGGSERVKVLDFGIARVTVPGSSPDATNLTRVGAIMGTVAYMSPEQATGKSVDGRTDLYALGVMLYEMLAGRPPFEAELPTQVLARQLVEAPPPLPEGTPPALSALVFDLMEKRPEDRPASADAVLERIGALSVTPSGRVEPPRADRRRLTLYAVAGGVLLAAGLAWAALSDREPNASIPSASAEPPFPPDPLPSSAPATASASGAPSAAGSSEPEVAPAAASAASTTPKPAAKRAGKSSSQQKKPASGKSSQPEKQKRRTGPGGIYIPPPSEWF